MSDKELFLEIGRITSSAHTVDEAIKHTQSLLGNEVGHAVLFVRPIHAGASLFSETEIREFLDSREYPFRGIYTSYITTNGEDVAILIACFGSWGAPGDLLRRATEEISIQLASLLGRDRNQILARQEAA
jgi:hypothetical protein